MNVDVRCKQGQISQFFKDYAEKRLERLSKLSININTVEVVTVEEGHFCSVELHMTGDLDLRATATTGDFMESMDRAAEKLIKQATRKKIHSLSKRRERRKAKQRQKFEEVAYADIKVA